VSVIISADWHFSDNSRDQYRHDFQNQFREIVRNERADAVVILGDLTEVKNNHEARLVNQIAEHIHTLTKLCPVIIIRGNHDYTDPDEPFFRFLRYMPYVSWINEPTDATTLRSVIGPTMLLPNTTDPERDWQGINFKPFDWVLTHNTFKAAQAAPGIRLGGIDPEEWFPPSVEIISGDIHVPHTIGHVTYVGAPYLVDFGDRYRPRVLKLVGNQAHSIRVAGPQKRLVRITSLKDLSRVEVAKGDIVKVEVELEAHQYDDWVKLSTAVREWGVGVGVNLNIVKPVIQQPAAAIAPKLKERQTDDELMAAYATARGVDERTVKTGRWLMSEER